MRTYRQNTEPVEGYPIDAWWAVVEPPSEDISNLVTNPSLETGTTNWTALGGSIARTLNKQRRGAYSLEITPTSASGNGAFYGTIATTAGTRYLYSLDVWGSPGKPYTAYWATTGGTILQRTDFIGKGAWERIEVPYIETSSTTRRLYLTKNGGTNTDLFYLDGVMVIAGVDDFAPWLYFDGDSNGLTPLKTDFYWIGTPHGSASVMRAHTRDGGIIRPLSDYGFTLLGMLGTGLPNPNNVSIPLLLPGGEHYQRTLASARSFDLVGTLTADSFPQLQRQHRELEKALNVRRQPVTEPLVLLYHPVDERGNKNGEHLSIVCSLEGGLDSQRLNHYQENVSLRFRVHNPYLGSLDGTEASVLDVRDDITDAEAVLIRGDDGIWGNTQTGISGGAVYALVWLPDGRLLVGGDFTNAAGIANADYLAVYDPVSDTYAALNATPLNGIVRALLLLPSGNVLVGGDFTNAGGSANADHLTLLTIATGAFSALNATPLTGGGTITQVLALALLPDGNVAVGGDFTNAGGAATADGLAKLTMSTGAYSAFTSVSLSPSYVSALAVDKSGSLWVGGGFITVDGITGQDFMTGLRGPSYSTFSQIFTEATAPLNALVNGILPMSNGQLLVMGLFTDVNGDTSWDYLVAATPSIGFGSSLTLGLKKLFSNIDGSVYVAAETTPGVVVVGGNFSTVENLNLFDSLFQFSGTSLTPVDIDYASVIAQTQAMAVSASGKLAVGFTLDAATAYTSGTTEVTNTGSADAFPVIVISYSSAATVVAPLYSIRNLATGKVISFNLSLLPGEVLTLDLRSGLKSLTSSVRGNLTGLILPSSGLTTFRLIPGPNRLNVFIDIASAADASAYVWWIPTYESLEGAVP